MAKLSGVKTLDMTNGEVTKVEYNGEVYESMGKGLSEAKTGDLFMSEGSSNTIDGGFYYINVDKELRHSVRFVDESGDNNGYMPGCSIHTLFRKVNAAPSADTHRLGAYALVTDREPKAGDFVKYTESPYSFIKVGKYYEINEIDDGRPCHIDEDGDSVSLSHREKYEFYEKVNAEKITHNGATYTLVDRKAQPGDVVVFTETKSKYFTNGKPYGPVTEYMTVVDNEGDDCLPVYFGSHNRTPANVKVYEPRHAKQVAPVAKEKPLEVGDYAKVVNKVYEYDAGNLVKIVGDRTNSDARIFDFKVEFVNVTGRSKYANQTHGYIDAKDIVHATDEEVAEAKAKLKDSLINEGDFVKIIAKNDGHCFKIGEFVKIKQKRGYDDFTAEYLDGSDYWYVGIDEIEKLSAEEAAELSRWAAIGRKPNEYKIGDFVKYKKCFAEVTRVGIYDISIEAPNGIIPVKSESLTLIAPVEQRFDLTKGRAE